MIIIGATGSIVGTAIWKLAAEDVDYSSFTQFLAADIKLPVWTLILFSMLVALMLNVVTITKNNSKLELKLKSSEVEEELKKLRELASTPKDIEDKINEKERRTKIAKRIISFLKEDAPKKSDALYEQITKTADFTKDEVQDAIDELVHFQILDNHISGGFKLDYTYESKFKRHF